MIKKKIRELLIDDVDFFAGDGEYDYVNFLIDVVYPEILETYKIRESKLFYKRLLRTADYDDPNDENEQGQVQLKDNPMIIELEVKDKRMEELIRREQEMLLGKSTEEIPDKDIITFITENSRSHLEAADLIKLYKCQRPWYIWPFFDNWDRLTLLLTYYEEYKSFPSSSAQFYQQLVCFLLRKNETTMSKNGISALTKMFSEFAYDMMKKNQNIFSIQTICDYPLFKDYLGTEDIQLTDLVSFPFIIQRGKWYTFQTIAFQSYLSIKKFLSFDQETIKKSYCDFLDLRGCFADNEHNIWLLCSELDLSAFNHYYVYPSLNEYLKAVNSTNNRTICSTTLQFLGYSVFFKISRSTPYPILVNGSSFNSIIPVSLLEFISKDLFDLDSYLSETIDSSDPIMFQRLSDFIIQNGSKGSSKNEYELNLAECSTDQGLLNIFDALGVCKTLSKLYYDVIRLVQKTTVANYNIRLDRYLSDSKIRIFASTT
ncbi:MAG: hypothetical protein K0S24_5118, partial [Sphingobacterium sp.]|jgi:hypothetical protein|nr:hypothetical protein [Sphingobacterium sp.]